jgi:hypothetical protein
MAVFKDYKQDPDDTLDWIFDWSLWLGEFEAITLATFIVDPGITVYSTGSSQKTATVWLTGGTEGQVYKVTCRITTSEGRIKDQSFTLRCANT